MLSDVSDFASQHGLQIVMALAIAVFASLSVAQWLILRRHNTRFTTALNNMTQGLCMWSATGSFATGATPRCTNCRRGWRSREPRFIRWFNIAASSEPSRAMLMNTSPA